MINPDVSAWKEDDDHVVRCQHCRNHYHFFFDWKLAHDASCPWLQAHLASNRQVPESASRSATRQLLTESK